MKVVIETLGNEIVSDYCFKGWAGAVNDGHDVEKMSINNVILNQERLRNERPMPIGSVEYMEYFFDLYGIEKPKPLHQPEYLKLFTARNIWTVNSRNDLDYSTPVFVKPLNDVKKFTGFVSTKKKDWDLYPELSQWDGPLLCSTVMDKNIMSEWRMFIGNNNCKNISIYTGSPYYIPNPYYLTKIYAIFYNNIREKSLGLPIAYTIDVAVFEDGSCDVIELNDMWAIGPYGCDEDTYFKLLKSRWNELLTY